MIKVTWGGLGERGCEYQERQEKHDEAEGLRSHSATSEPVPDVGRRR